MKYNEVKNENNTILYTELIITANSYCNLVSLIKILCACTAVCICLKKLWCTLQKDRQVEEILAKLIITNS